MTWHIKHIRLSLNTRATFSLSFSQNIKICKYRNDWQTTLLCPAPIGWTNSFVTQDLQMQMQIHIFIPHRNLHTLSDKMRWGSIPFARLPVFYLGNQTPSNYSYYYCYYWWGRNIWIGSKQQQEQNWTRNPFLLLFDFFFFALSHCVVWCVSIVRNRNQ